MTEQIGVFFPPKCQFCQPSQQFLHLIKILTHANRRMGRAKVNIVCVRKTHPELRGKSGVILTSLLSVRSRMQQKSGAQTNWFKKWIQNKDSVKMYFQKIPPPARKPDLEFSPSGTKPAEPPNAATR